MAGVLPMDEDTYRAAMARWVLRRIRRRQKALRRKWHELPKDQVEAELLAIGRQLVEAAPLIFPWAFGSGGKAGGSQNGRGSSRNGHDDGVTERPGPDVAGRTSVAQRGQGRMRRNPGGSSLTHEAREELFRAAEDTLDELERLFRELNGDQPTAGSSR